MGISGGGNAGGGILWISGRHRGGEYRDFHLCYLIHVKRQPGERREIATSHDLTIVHEGEFTYIVDGEPITIRAGEAYFCPHRTMRERRACSAPVSYTALNFMYTSKGEPLPFPRHIRNAASADAKYLLRQLLAVYEERAPYYRERANALLTLLLCEILRCNPPETKPEENPYVREMKRLITADISRRITVEEIADTIHLYPTYCSELFRRETGMTISEYAVQERVEAAKELLGDSSLTIRDVAEQTGFCDRFYFSRIFRQKAGQSPTEYRQMIKELAPLPAHKVEIKRI